MKIIKKIVKWLLILLTFVSIVIATLWLLNAPEQLSETSVSRTRLDQGDYVVEKVQLEVVDDSRPTDAVGGYEGDDKRVLKGAIWMPEGNSKGHPLVIYNHGFSGYHRDSTYLVEYLARNGYVVAAVDFPLSSAKAPSDVPQLNDVVNQPGDVSKLIDHILSMNSDSESVLYQRIDINNIGVMGLSLGGLTTGLVSFHPDYKDSRIKVAIMMAPPMVAFNEKFFANNRSVNSLLISGSLDRVVPQKDNALDVIPRNPRGWFLGMDKGTHLGFADIANYIRWVENPDNLGCALFNLRLERLNLPEKWSDVLPNTGGVLRDVKTAKPCPELAGQSMNGLKQQWLTRLSIGAFFDMHLRAGEQSKQASDFFTTQLLSENPSLSLKQPN